MIVEAIDKQTNRTVKIEEAYSGQRLACPYCGVDVHPVLGGDTQFFRCYEGGKHTDRICKQLDRTNRAYDSKLTDIEELFDNLFHPVREKEEPSWESDEDEGLVEPDLEENLYGDESEYWRTNQQNKTDRRRNSSTCAGEGIQSQSVNC